LSALDFVAAAAKLKILLSKYKPQREYLMKIRLYKLILVVAAAAVGYAYVAAITKYTSINFTITLNFLTKTIVINWSSGRLCLAC